MKLNSDVIPTNWMISILSEWMNTSFINATTKSCHMNPIWPYTLEQINNHNVIETNEISLAVILKATRKMTKGQKKCYSKRHGERAQSFQTCWKRLNDGTTLLNCLIIFQSLCRAYIYIYIYRFIFDVFWNMNPPSAMYIIKL